MKKLLFLSAVYFASFANAQYNPQVFTNLYTGPDSYRGPVSLFNSAVLNNKLVFNVLDDPDYKLYVTDGTVANTIAIKNIKNPVSPFIFDNKIYFSLRDTTNGEQLWRTDGTANGTILVATLGGNGYGANYFTVLGNKLFFASSDSLSFGRRLYMLEAGSNSPVLLKTNFYQVSNLIAFNGKIYFNAADTEFSTNKELYTSDGTVAGTTLLKDINPGTEGSNPNGFLVFQNKLFFAAKDAVAGNEIWTSDGTANGTQLLKDINPGTADAFSQLKTGSFNNKLYFAANDGTNGIELWSTDGSAIGTSLLKDINPNGDSSVNNFVTVNGKLLMTANDGTHGNEFWVSDGTTANTNLLLDIKPGIETGVNGVFKNNLLCANQLFFNGVYENYQLEPFVTDGTAAGTKFIKDINPTGNSSDADTIFVLLGDKIFFVANDGTANKLYVMDSNCANMSVANTNLTDFQIFPNPAKDFINIESKTAIEKVEIYNAAGQLVLNSVGNKKQIDIRKLSAGVYVMKITNIHKNTTSKTIIIK